MEGGAPGPGCGAQGRPGGVVFCARNLLKDHSKYGSSLFSIGGETKKDCSLQVCIPGKSLGDG